MPSVTFTANLRRHLRGGPSAIPVDATTVREALDAVVAEHPALRDQVLDSDGSLWPHVTIFVGDRQVEDRDGLSDSLESASDDTEIHVMQSLAGG